MARSTEQVFEDHHKALSTGDLAALLADYADDAVLLSTDGVSVGKAAIQAFFVNAFSALPNAQLSIKRRVVHGDYLLVTWTGVSDAGAIPYGVDSFVIHDDKIRLQTVWFTMAPK
jgi:ketosteroid isomerase-like protein